MEVRARRGQEKAEDRVVTCLCGREEGKEPKTLPSEVENFNYCSWTVACEEASGQYVLVCTFLHLYSSLLVLNVFPSTPLSPSIQRDNYDGTR